MAELDASSKNAGTGTRTRTSQPLPLKLIEDGARRFAWIGPIAACLVVSIEVAQFYLQPELVPVFRDPINRLLTLLTVFLGFGILALHRYRAVSSSTIVALGGFFHFVVAATVSMIETTRPFDATEPMIGLSALGPWVFTVGAF